MTKIPWKFRTQPDPNREYIIAATTGLQADWQNLRKMFAFLRYTLLMVQELQQATGGVGFALRGSFGNVQGATISVWEDVESLRRFIVENPHGEAARVLRSEKRAETQFQYIQWKCRGDALPVTWKDADTHFSGE